MSLADDPTHFADYDEALGALKTGASAWAALSPADIAAHLKAVRGRVLDVADEWVSDSARAKGLPSDSPLVGEEWASGPWAFLAGLNGVIHTLESLASGSDPLRGLPIRERADGQVAVRVFPATRWDSLLLSGFSAEVWQKPEVTRANLKDHIAGRFRDGGEASVHLVLGAGNINSIPPLDVLYKLVAEGAACIVKLNPINAYLQPHFDHIFAPLIDLNVVRFVQGDGAGGAYLAEHALVDAMHITGSGITHDRIVWGDGDEATQRKAAGTPRNPRPITSELGGVGPTLVVPGPWTKADFRFQAEHLVTQKLHNGGCNCIASQVLVVPDQWDGTDTLLAAVREVLAEIPSRPAYYRGSEAKISAFKEAYPEAEETSTDPSFLWVDGLDPEAPEYLYDHEAFGQVWGVVRLQASEPAAFLSEAVRFANDKLDGTLGAQIVIHPSTERALGAAFEEAIAQLRYGSIGVNAWSGVAFLLPNAMWGAFPGHTLEDVQSGIGVVHNALLFDDPQKTVVRGPFQPFPRTLARGLVHMSPKPVWFVTHGKAASAAKLLTKFEATRNVALIPPLFAAALRG